MMKHGLNGTIPASVANAKKLNEALTLGHNLAKLLAELAFSYVFNSRYIVTCLLSYRYFAEMCLFYFE